MGDPNNSFSNRLTAIFRFDELQPLAFEQSAVLGDSPNDVQQRVGEMVLTDQFNEDKLRNSLPWVGDTILFFAVPPIDAEECGSILAAVDPQESDCIDGTLSLVITGPDGRISKGELTALSPSAELEGNVMPSDWDNCQVEISIA